MSDDLDSTAKPFRVLVVDDMLTGVEAVVGILDPLPGFSARGATTGAEALAVAAGFQPDVAVLDMVMPGVNGLELLSLLQQSIPGIQAVFLTGSMADHDVVSALDHGAFAFLRKPCDPLELRATVRRACEHRRLFASQQRLLRDLGAELERARRFQAELLPTRKEEVAGCRLAWGLAPSRETNGDFVDFVQVDGTTLAAIIADVSGHGVPAAMLTTVVKSCFWSAADEGFDPQAVVRRLYYGLRPFGPSRFLTCFVLRMDGAQGRLGYVNAGHPPGLILGGASAAARELGATGPLVTPGLESASWETGEAALASGETLLLYTDGILEARKGEDFFGLDGILAAAAGGSGSPREIVDRMLQAATRFSMHDGQRDDMTVLTLRAGDGP